MSGFKWCVIGVLLIPMDRLGFTAVVTRAETEVRISLYNLAGVPGKDLGQAEQLATQIFAESGVKMNWTAELLSRPSLLISDFTASRTGICDQSLTTTELIVQILHKAPNGFSPAALGFALPCARRGVQVTIYLDRVEKVSGQTSASLYRVLGYAISHEIGHVLLRSNRHTPQGLMRGVWDSHDWQRAAVSTFSFTSEESARMQRELLQFRPGCWKCGNVAATSNREKLVDRASSVVNGFPSLGTPHSAQSFAPNHLQSNNKNFPLILFRGYDKARYRDFRLE